MHMNETLFANHPSRFADQPSRIPHEASQASCFWCEAPHPAAHALSVCPACAGNVRTGTFPMGALAMLGSFPLTDDAIDERLTRTSPGNYALGFMDGETFVVSYVGRSDSDVGGRLREWVGTPSSLPSGQAVWGFGAHGPLSLELAMQAPGAAPDDGYTRFAYSYAPSAAEAFQKEWRNYEDFGGSDGLDNSSPPSQGRIEA